MVSKIVTEDNLFETSYKHVYIVSSTDIEVYQKMQGILATKLEKMQKKEKVISRGIEISFVSYAQLRSVGISESLQIPDSIIIFDDSYLLEESDISLINLKFIVSTLFYRYTPADTEI